MRREKLARLFRAASNVKRIALVRALTDKTMTIKQLADHTCMPYKTVERHLKILQSVKLIREQRQGLEIDLSINADEGMPYHQAVIDLIRKSL